MVWPLVVPLPPKVVPYEFLTSSAVNCDPPHESCTVGSSDWRTSSRSGNTHCVSDRKTTRTPEQDPHEKRTFTTCPALSVLIISVSNTIFLPPSSPSIFVLLQLGSWASSR